MPTLVAQFPTPDQFLSGRLTRWRCRSGVAGVAFGCDSDVARCTLVLSGRETAAAPGDGQCWAEVEGSSERRGFPGDLLAAGRLQHLHSHLAEHLLRGEAALDHRP